ncbi:MazG nucleotide pyrophosphohydrolase domain-containing protein, partial [Streptococcus agalactiae]|uniref:MazG nucleotide pyrophosphohydrolase domain-containing protein n=1 Tax=Streptococcus agalactiae TaxID=1311 RepID=UPI001103901B
NLNDIKEELGDVLDNIFILADQYNISLEEIISAHRTKLEKRFFHPSLDCFCPF